MKSPSLWTDATMKPPFVLLVMITISMIWASDVLAYDNYSGCEVCHGDFRDSPYTSLSNGSSWPDGLHNTHRNTMLTGDCDTCHVAAFSPVSLENSTGGAGLMAISCVGCHGRDEDNGNATATGNSQRGAGLRQKHLGSVNCMGCHQDQTGYTPVGENVLPNYYVTPITNHPSMPDNPCNLFGGENFAATSAGLDNDGDGTYDDEDSDCQIPTDLIFFDGFESG